MMRVSFSRSTSDMRDYRVGRVRRLEVPRTVRTPGSVSLAPGRVKTERSCVSPEEPPFSNETLVLWQIGQAVHRYIDRIFEAGGLCPFGAPETTDAA
jgi:hypothetical protein